MKSGTKLGLGVGLGVELKGRPLGHLASVTATVLSCLVIKIILMEQRILAFSFNMEGTFKMCCNSKCHWNHFMIKTFALINKNFIINTATRVKGCLR